ASRDDDGGASAGAASSRSLASMRRKTHVGLDPSPMGVALELARHTARLGNVPVGAVVVVDGEIVGRGANLRDVLQDPTAHAEVLALRDAAQRLGSWRLEK